MAITLVLFQVHTFYEAVGYMIAASTDEQQQEQLIEKYMLLPNQVWDDIITQVRQEGFFSVGGGFMFDANLFPFFLQASRNVDVLKDQEAVKQLGSILKTNVRACKALGHPFVVQLGRIYLDMLNVYKVSAQTVDISMILRMSRIYDIHIFAITVHY